MKRFPLVFLSIFCLTSAAIAGGPRISVTVTPTHVTNQGDEAVFTFTLSEPATRRIAVQFLLSGGADLGSDYVLLGNFNKSGQLVIPVGATSAMVTLRTLEEDIENDGVMQFATLDILDAPRYRVGSPSRASVRIRNTQE